MFPAVVFLMARACRQSYGLYKLLITSFTIAMITGNIALDIIQVKADYLTRYCYGDRGTKALINYLRENIRNGDNVIACRDIVFYVDRKLPLLGDDIWYHPDAFIQVLQHPKTKYVIYSIGHNDIRQFFTTLHNPVVNTTLKRNFVKFQIGTYTIWTKKLYNIVG